MTGEHFDKMLLSCSVMLVPSRVLHHGTTASSVDAGLGVGKEEDIRKGAK